MLWYGRNGLIGRLLMDALITYGLICFVETRLEALGSGPTSIFWNFCLNKIRPPVQLGEAIIMKHALGGGGFKKYPILYSDRSLPIGIMLWVFCSDFFACIK